MFFIASKVAWFVLAPSNLMLIALVAGLALATFERVRGFGLGLAWTAAIALALFGLTPVASLLMHPLETRFPPYADDAAPVDGIVVLGGAIAQDATLELGQAVVNEAADRLIAAAVLARRHPDVPIVLSGGSARLVGTDRFTEAQAMANVLVDMGVARERLLVEDRSRNTWQNAVFSRELASPEPDARWLLVTSAWHMPRSMGVFRRAGFAVVPYPTDFRTVGGTETTSFFRSISGGLQRLDVAAREYVGLLAYRLTGRTDTLFPGA
ncbi:YdcF family protein [Salinarimonas ramus]|uniref:Membrane protein n=1 Tax=Salinarimonas ramus TaxID=690164 RepID=A0A917QBS8_9HYPH|nr:YdcF family protein [Salinarimonas ramus]GGK43079.1 membrane protein [Salinarimonas ramus]